MIQGSERLSFVALALAIFPERATIMVMAALEWFFIHDSYKVLALCLQTQ